VVDREEQAGAVPEGAAEEGHEYSGFLQHLGPDWVEIEPGIFQPPEAPPPEPPAELESLDEALRPRVAAREPEEHAPEPPARRTWWRHR
jgi:hypothetical protein